MLSWSDADAIGRRRLLGGSPDKVVAMESCVELPLDRCGTRTPVLGSILVVSGRSWPARGWVESVVIGITGSQTAGAGCPPKIPGIIAWNCSQFALKHDGALVLRRFGCGTCILRVSSRAGRPRHFPNCISTPKTPCLTVILAAPIV
jgi:hypothetical protein